MRIFHVLLVAAALVLGAVGISRLSYNVDVLDLLPRDLAGLEGTKRLRDNFQRANRLIIAIEANDARLAADAGESLGQFLQARPQWCQKVQAKPAWEGNPAELAEMAAYAWWNAPPENTRALAGRLAPENIPAHLAGVIENLGITMDGKELALGNWDPLGMTRALLDGVGSDTIQGGQGGSEFASGDGTFRVIFLEPATPQANYKATAAWLAEIRRCLADWQSSDPAWRDVRLSLTGDPAFRAEISTGMEADMTRSVGGITFIVAFLFWLLHRTLKPLGLLLAALMCANLITLGVAGLLFGSLNVMSMGFAAILIGMIEDFGVVALHDAQDHPELGFPAICRRVGPGIFWSATTTACVFGAMALSSLPGLSQLGVLTALGILIGAVVMLFGFLPVAMRLAKVRREPAARDWRRHGWTGRVTALLVGTVVATAVVVLAGMGLPPVMNKPGVLRPTRSEAFDTFERMQEKLAPKELQGSWLPIVIGGSDAVALAAAVDRCDHIIRAARARGEIASSVLPGELVPRLSRQAANARLLAALAADKARIRQAMVDAGFTDDAFTLAGNVLDIWARWAIEEAPEHTPRWPSPALLDGTFGAFLQRGADGPNASGYVTLAAGHSTDARVVGELAGVPGVYPAGWGYLNDHLKPLLGTEARRVCLPAAVVLLLLLPCVFRGIREIVLAVGTLALGGLVLLAVMSALGQTWNIVSIAAIPLTLGLGLDFTIHMIYSLRQVDGPGGAASTGIGRALAYCGLSTGLGFGSLAMAGNQGLASLGICAMTGVLATLFAAAFVLPWVWRIWPPARGPAPSAR